MPLGNDTKEQTVYIRFHTLRPIEIPIQIGTLALLLKSKNKTDYFIAGFVGLMLAMLIYNFFLLLATRDTFYFWYICYGISSLSATLFVNNHPEIFSIFGKTILNTIHRHPFIMINTPFVFIGIFTINFLKLKNYKALYYIFLVTILFYLFVFPLIDFFEIISHNFLVRICQPTTVLCMLMLLATSLYIWLIKKDKNARFYFNGWFWVTIGILCYFFTVNGFIEYNFITRSSTLFGVGIESLMFSLALADRINSMRLMQENIQSENIQLISNQNQILESAVKKRTFELSRTTELLEISNEVAQIGTWEIDLVNDIGYWSKITREIHEVDYERQPDLEESLLFYKEGESRNKIIQAVKQIMTDGTPFNLDLQIITGRGNEKWVNAIGHAEKENGKCIRIFGTFQDISKQKQIEEELANANSFHISILDSLSEHIAVIDSSGIIIAVNAAWKKFASENGSGEKDFIATNYLNICKNASYYPNGEEAGDVTKGILAVLKGEIPEFTIEYPCHSPTKYRWFLMYACPIDFPQKGAVISHFNITDRKLTEIALQSKEDLLKTISDNLPDGALYQLKHSKDGSFHFPYISAGIERLLGVSPKDVLDDAKNLFSLTHREDLERIFIAQRESEKYLTPFEQIHRQYTATRELKWLLLRSMPRRMEDGSTVWDGVVFDITEIKKTREELKIAKEQAEAANRAKSEFLANMSHEIRTPLNGIIGFTELLIKSKLDESQALYMNTVSKSAFLLLDLINDILDFSKIEAGKLELNVEMFNLTELISHSLDIVKIQIKNKPIEIVANLPTDKKIFVMGDEIRLRQILINLLGNAIKFTEKGRIEMNLEILELNSEKENSILRFSVIDTGIGISKENLEKIFEAFSQEDSTITRKYGGTGLGLSISNKLLGLMNSKLELDSEVGKGSKFHFTLKTKLEVKDLEEKENPNTIPFSNKEQDTKKKDFYDNSNFTVLIAEDNEVNTLLTTILIKRYLPSAKIIEAVNGKQVVEKFISEKPSLILMDIQMPEMNGYEATREIRKFEEKSSTPIIALSAGTSQESLKECLESGMNDFISKPILPADFEVILTKWLPKIQLQEVKLDTKLENQNSIEHFNKEKLKARLGVENNEILDQILLLAKKNLPESLHELKTAINSQSFEAVKKIAHKIKGSALSLSFENLGAIALNMEKLSSFDLPKINRLQTEMEEELNYLFSII
ncbi:MAG: response regulator [Leptospiraceae bacterium]|nr:response regulator [Leptospiraceae bacterium]